MNHKIAFSLFFALVLLMPTNKCSANGVDTLKVDIFIEGNKIVSNGFLSSKSNCFKKEQLSTIDGITYLVRSTSDTTLLNILIKGVEIQVPIENNKRDIYIVKVEKFRWNSQGTEKIGVFKLWKEKICCKRYQVNFIKQRGSTVATTFWISGRSRCGDYDCVLKKSSNLSN